MPDVNEQRRSEGSRGSAPEPESTPPDPSLRSSADFGFTGTFVSDDMEVAGSLQISSNRVILWASGSQLASWDISECRVERRSVTKFEVHGDGESLTFTADDPTGLDEAISALPKASVDTRTRRRGSDEGRTSTPVERKTTETREKVTEPIAHTVPEEVEEDSVEAEPAPPKPKRQPVSRRSRTGAYQIPRREPEAPLTHEPEAPVIREPEAPVTRRPRIKTFQVAPADLESSAQPMESPLARERLIARPADDEDEEFDETIADEAVARATGTRVRAARWLKSDIKDVGVKVAAVALASVLLGGFAYSIYVLAGGTGYEPDVFVEDPTASTLPRPSTTAPASAVVTQPVPPTTLFDTFPAELTDRWNRIAEASRPELVLIRDLTSPVLVAITPYITMEGVLDPNGGYLTLRTTPTATPEGDGAILTSLGMLVAMSDPTLEPVDRRLLLEALGLDVRDPQLAGIDASLSYNGLTYRLTYFQDQNVLEFAVTPEVLATTTTTSP